MLGFDTIGNATLLVWDGEPLLATDPWLDGNPYFGSWGLPREIHEDARDAVARCKWLWLSHGHPDHLFLPSMSALKPEHVLLPDHVGGRIKEDLEQAGYDVRVLPDGEWFALSDRVSVMSLSDYFQDAALIVRVGQDLVLNLNDVTPGTFPWTPLLQKLVPEHRRTFLLKKLTYRDADMTNFFDEEGARVRLHVEPSYVADYARFWADVLDVDFVIPFSSFHRYTRTDSQWAEETVAPLSAFDDFDRPGTQMLPAYTRWSVDDDAPSALPLGAACTELLTPEDAGDDWSQDMERSDRAKLDAYFGAVKELRRGFDYITVRFGTREHTVALRARGFRRGVTFEAPRKSFMDSVEWRVFDDMLIANFMKTTLHGRYAEAKLYPTIGALTRIADNGGARTRREVAAYLATYAQRAPALYLRNLIERQAQQLVRPVVIDHPRLFGPALNAYRMFKKA
jgi:hypothetical protein